MDLRGISAVEPIVRPPCGTYISANPLFTSLFEPWGISPDAIKGPGNLPKSEEKDHG